ncbi:MAG: DUF202 domain-containing protein [Oligoflexia bacterium]|nr:DUF202 domain-containing protein [Oligoflexia bacterium]MBF0366286.1 DUF202 domain-containing protein [Oligoflexia bacterium]
MTNNKRPYSQFNREQLILRDWLAIDRTILANKRTLLAYIRTSMTFCISGVTAIHFIETPWIKVFGFIFAIISIVMLFYGFYDFYKYYKDIQKLLNENKPDAIPN